MAAYRRVYRSHLLQADTENRDQLRNPTLGNRVWAIPLPYRNSLGSIERTRCELLRSMLSGAGDCSYHSPDGATYTAVTTTTQSHV